MEGMISLKEVLEIMQMKDDAGMPLKFKIRIVTCNLKEGTGGEHREYDRAFLVAGGRSSKTSKKNPRNWMNFTRTVQVPGKGRPITIHPLTIISFNDEEVYI